MARTAARRIVRPTLDPLEGRQMLSAALPTDIAPLASQSGFAGYSPAPQSASPVTTRVTVTPERPSTSPGEAVRLTLTQTITGRSPVNLGPLANYDVVVSQRGRELWRYSDDRGPIDPPRVLVTLRPGQSRQAEVTWDGRARNGMLVSGPVQIRATVDRVDSSPIAYRIAGAPQGPTPRPSASPSNLGNDGLPPSLREFRERALQRAELARTLARERMAARLAAGNPGPWSWNRFG